MYPPPDPHLEPSADDALDQDVCVPFAAGSAMLSFLTTASVYKNMDFVDNHIKEENEDLASSGGKSDADDDTITSLKINSEISEDNHLNNFIPTSPFQESILNYYQELQPNLYLDVRNVHDKAKSLYEKLNNLFDIQPDDIFIEGQFFLSLFHFYINNILCKANFLLYI